MAEQWCFQSLDHESLLARLQAFLEKRRKPEEHVKSAEVVAAFVQAIELADQAMGETNAERRQALITIAEQAAELLAGFMLFLRTERVMSRNGLRALLKLAELAIMAQVEKLQNDDEEERKQLTLNL